MRRRRRRGDGGVPVAVATRLVVGPGDVAEAASAVGNLTD